MARNRRDPTAVLGRRSLAWFVDAAIFIAAFAVPIALFGQIFRGRDIARHKAGPGFTHGDFTFFFHSRVLVVPGGRFWMAVGLFALVVIGSLLIVEGATGATVGKAIFGVRVVTRDRPRPGFGRALARTLLWVIDLIPIIILPVAFVLASFTKGHRRVGDLVAGTFVVNTDFADRLKNRQVVDDRTDTGERPSDSYDPVPEVSEVMASGPVPMVVAAPVAADQAPPPEQERSTEPIWDDRLDTYVRWEPRVARWIGWSEAEQRWKVVDRGPSS